MTAVFMLSLAVSFCPLQSPETVTLAGRVVDVHDAVVPAATVIVACEGVRREARTDGAGRFRLTGLPPAACLVSAERGLLASGMRAVNLAGTPLEVPVPKKTIFTITPDYGKQIPNTKIQIPRKRSQHVIISNTRIQSPSFPRPIIKISNHQSAIANRKFDDGLFQSQIGNRKSAIENYFPSSGIRMQ